jgi:hypothetical protein
MYALAIVRKSRCSARSSIQASLPVKIPVIFRDGLVCASPLLSCAGSDCGVIKKPAGEGSPAGFR